MVRVFHAEIKKERLEDESGEWDKTQSFVTLNKRSRRDDRISRIPDPEQQ
jgi:hypothetical protein